VIRPFGEAALHVETETAERAQALASGLRTDPIPGVTAAVPALASLLVEFDAFTADRRAVAGALERRLADPVRPITDARVRTIPVVYGGEFGPDVPEVAAITGLSQDEVVERHASTELRVLFDGFAAGFAYLGELPADLRAPRLDTPRSRTPAGSVGIAGSMSGIYPASLPGGWRIIGRTPLTLFEPRLDPPAYLLPGDRVRFEAIDAAAWDEHVGAPDDW
jgi:KipI family sensor histidine kinase inhibitor